MNGHPWIFFFTPAQVELKVSSKESTVISNLQHFTSYKIEIMACNHPTDLKRCSMATYISARTMPEGESALHLLFKSTRVVWQACTLQHFSSPKHARKIISTLSLFYLHGLIRTEKADDIPGQVTHELMNGEPASVFIKWKAPVSPNGLIILYEVFYRKVGETEVSTAPPGGLGTTLLPHNDICVVGQSELENPLRRGTGGIIIVYETAALLPLLSMFAYIYLWVVCVA